MFFAVVGLIIVFYMLRIQLSPWVEDFKAQESMYLGSWRTLRPVRGKIMDRSGHMLAGNQTVYEVGVELKEVENPESIALALSVVLGLDFNDVFKVVNQEPTDRLVYIVLTDFVTPDEIAQLEALQEDNFDGKSSDGEPHNLSGLAFRPHLQRSYPEKDLASNILGFVGRDYEGYFGIEGKLNDLLAGVPKTVWIPQDPNRVVDLPELPEGATLILTIDREIQAEMETILDNALNESGAESGTIVVMHPQTGEILAMASTPRIDLNEFWSYQDSFKEGEPFNRAVHIYEPGSVFKVITMASALDVGAVKPDTNFLDVGAIEVGGIVINNWNFGAWGPQTMLGCMQHSLNVCLAWVATQMGAKDFYDYLQAFGFGRLTGIELAEELPGRLKIPGDSDWYEADLGTNSFGQGVSVTPVQMLMAISAVANEGKMVVPHLLQAVVDRGNQYGSADSPPRIAGTPISPKTARTLTNMLVASLENEASTALLPGYRIAGKTGTAEIPTPNGYTSSLTNASFVGWGPVDDPQFMIYVWLSKPTTSPWGSVVAAPVFRQVVERLVVLMDIPPDGIRKALSINSQPAVP
ncbi:MAG: penicillin-binding protein 2 [Anaerolineales bacterium]